MANILVVYGAKSYPLRATTQDHLYSFRRYSDYCCFYFNMLSLGKPWYRKAPRFIQQTKFDLVIFHPDLLNIQWPPYSLEKFTKQAEYFNELKAVKIALMQDEFYHTDILERFVNEYGITHVFTLASESEWRKIYPAVDQGRVKFHRALPGYLDEKRLKEITCQEETEKDRPITVGYRAVKQQNMHWLGRHGFKKLEIADLFKRKAKELDLPTDISTNAEDALLGDEWYKFLLRCKYTIAVEGGASILDHDGTVREKTEAYLLKHPQASFEEVERACFPGRDGELNYAAISPKHLESCATKTCQILVEGDYNGILKPGVHYIELKQDFSNIDQVMAMIQRDNLREQITERVYKDIVEAGAYTYRAFVSWVLGLALQNSSKFNSSGLRDQLVYAWSRIFELSQWMNLAMKSSSIRIIRRFLPAGFETFLRKTFA